MVKKVNFDFEELKSKALAAVDTVKKKAGSLSGMAKANVAIFQEEDKIKKAEAELGRLYYNDFITGAEANAEAYQAVCDRITASKVLIEGLKAELSDMKAADQAEPIVEEDEITEDDFVVVEETPAEEVPAEEAPAEAVAEEIPSEN